MSFTVFGQKLRIRIPIPVEAEKQGEKAKDDFEEFVRRKRYHIDMPMLVVAEAGYDTKEELRTLPVKFQINQIPIRRLKEEAQS